MRLVICATTLFFFLTVAIPVFAVPQNFAESVHIKYPASLQLPESGSLRFTVDFDATIYWGTAWYLDDGQWKQAQLPGVSVAGTNWKRGASGVEIRVPASVLANEDRLIALVYACDRLASGRWDCSKDAEGRNAWEFVEIELVRSSDTCGDGRCLPPESASSCRQDCLPNCGDGVCQEAPCKALGCPLPENEQNCMEDCQYPGEFDLYITPKISTPNNRFQIYVKNKAIDPISEQIFAFVYSSDGNRAKTVRLLNDGLHGDGEAHDYVSGNFFVISAEGNYSVTICIGSSVDICSEFSVPYFSGEPAVFQVKDIRCEPLYPEHNDRNADKINMVIVGSGYNDIEHLKRSAKHVLFFNGMPIILDFSKGNKTEKKLAMDMFSIEPLKSNKHKFNIWYLTEQFRGSPEYFILDFLGGGWSNDYFPYCNLSYIYPVLIANMNFDPDAINQEGFRSYAHDPSFKNNAAIDKSEIKFGVSLNSIPADANGTLIDTSSYGVVAHETGHALFGLFDEYDTGSHTEPSLGYPNCARNRIQAEEWWENFVGQIDPFYYELESLYEQEGDIIPFSENYVTTGYFNGGCNIPFEDSRAIRPTYYSIMNRRTDYIFGSVNRARAEQVLNLFSGN